MNKKAALTIGTTVVVILGLLVILLIVTGPLKVGYEYAKEKFFGETGVFSIVSPSREKDFVPNIGTLLSSKEKIIDDSFNALICAVNSLALGKPGWLEKDICPEGFTIKDPAPKSIGGSILSLTGMSSKEECNGALYGQSCVTCFNVFSAHSLKKEFTCSVADFEMPQEISFSGNLYDWAFGSINKFKDPEYVMYFESFPRGEDAAWHLDPKSTMISVVAFGAVTNFIFVGAGSLWKGAKGIKNIGVRALSRAFGKETAEAAASKTTKGLIGASAKIGAEVSEPIAKDLAESFTKEGYETLMRSERLFNEVGEGLSAGVSREASEELRETALNMYKYHKALGKTDDQIVESITEEFFKKTGKSSFAKGEIELIENGINRFVKESMSEAEQMFLARQQATRQFFVKYLMDGSGRSIGKEAMENFISKAFSKGIIAEMDDVAAEQFVRKSMEYADEIVDITKSGDDMIKTAGILGSVSDSVKGQFIKEYDTLADSIWNANSDTLLKMFTGTSAVEIKAAAKAAGEEATARAVAKAVAKKATKEEIEKISVNGYAAYLKNTARDFIPIKFKNSYFNIPRPVVIRTLVEGIPETAIRTAYVAAWRPRASRYLLAYLIGTMLAEADAANEKYAYYGDKAMILQKPYFFEKNTKRDLIDESSRYYINLFKYKDASSRFFLASPCKADLLITQTECSCFINPGDYLMRSSYNTQPFEPSSIDMSDPSVVRWINHFDTELIKKDQKELVDKTFSALQDKVGIYTKFNRGVMNTIITDPDIFVNFTKALYNYTYQPVFVYVKAHNDEYAQSHTCDLFTHFDKKIQSGDTIKKMFSSYYGAGPGRSHSDSFGIQFWGEEVFGAFNEFGLFAEGDISNKAAAKFRREPLSFGEFNREFLNGFYYGFSISGSTSEVVEKMLLRLRKLSAFADYNWNDLKDPIWHPAVRKTYFNYYLVKDRRVDTSKLVKLCDQSIPGKSGALDANLENIFETGRTPARLSVDCLNVDVLMDTEYPGYNFCYSADHSGIETIKTVLFVSAMAIDFVFGVTPLLQPIAVPVALVTGGGAAYAAERLDRLKYWPIH